MPAHLTACEPVPCPFVLPSPADLAACRFPCPKRIWEPLLPAYLTACEPRAISVFVTEPGRPSGLPIPVSVTDCGKSYRIWIRPVRLPRFSLRIWGTAPTPNQPVRAEGLGSPGWSAATPWDGCRARSPRPMPRPRRCFRQRPSRTPLGVRAKSDRNIVFVFL